MFRKILSTALALFLTAAVLMFPMIASAEPYKEIRIGEGETVIEAVWFDGGEDNYYDTESDGNHDIRPDELPQTYDYTINGDYAGGRETNTPSCIGWIVADEWVQYTVICDVAGNYQLDVWGAGHGGDFVGYCDDLEIGTAYVESDGGNWHDYVLFPVGLFNMTEGTHIIKAEFPDGGINIESLIVTLAEAGGTPPPPVWKPKNFQIGEGTTTITAVDFDAGATKYGKGGNPDDGSKAIRGDEDVNTETNEAENGYGGNIGWIGEGDWVQYTVRANTDGKYSFSAWIASDSDSPGNIEVYVGDVLVGASDNANKEGWQAYSLFSVGEIELTAGNQVIKVVFPSGNLNFSALEVTRTGDIDKPAETPENEGNPENGEENASPSVSDEGSEENGSVNMLIIIIAGAALVVVVVIILIVVTSKKKKK